MSADQPENPSNKNNRSIRPLRKKSGDSDRDSNASRSSSSGASGKAGQKGAAGQQKTGSASKSASKTGSRSSVKTGAKSSSSGAKGKGQTGRPGKQAGESAGEATGQGGKKTGSGKAGRPTASPSKTSSASGKSTGKAAGRGTGKAKAGAAGRGVGAQDVYRLNKFIAHSGLCSRREADDLIAAGRVEVNGEKVKEMGVKVTERDRVSVMGQQIGLDPHVYILMNKPRDTITTTDDERGRRTVMDLVQENTGHRLYPVGRLDRNTTGVLLLTNDGELAHRLMHPSFSIPKTYKVTTRWLLTRDQLDRLREGVKLEDGVSKPYKVSQDPENPLDVRLSLNEGRNHQVRRTIEAVGGDVLKLERIYYAGMTAKGIRPGRWRFLRPKEIKYLRQIAKLF